MNNVNGSMEKEVRIKIAKNFAVEEATKFREEVLYFINKGEKEFLLNFSECDFIDSTGLGVIVTIYKKCKELNGNVRLEKIKPQVMKLFKLTRLDKVLDIL